jgi:uncharacterized membrane-anchored protein
VLNEIAAAQRWALILLAVVSAVMAAAVMMWDCNVTAVVVEGLVDLWGRICPQLISAFVSDTGVRRR